MIIDAWLEEKEQNTQQPQCSTDAFGNKVWRVNGKLHRDDGPAAEYANGNKGWYQNNQLHREGGPAVEYSHGTKFWYQNGKRHRTDGSAVEFANGNKEWWLNGEQVSEEDITQNTEQLYLDKVNGVLRRSFEKEQYIEKWKPHVRDVAGQIIASAVAAANSETSLQQTLRRNYYDY